jgi:hypothetical protein
VSAAVAPIYSVALGTLDRARNLVSQIDACALGRKNELLLEAVESLLNALAYLEQNYDLSGPGIARVLDCVGEASQNLGDVLTILEEKRLPGDV